MYSTAAARARMRTQRENSREGDLVQDSTVEAGRLYFRIHHTER